METQTAENDILEKMEKFKKDYYDTNGKNSFFKKTQKMDCANEISKQFDINTMLKQTVFIIPGTNHIFFNYSVFKMYANENNYHQIINEITGLYDFVLVQYPNFVLHMDLHTFSVSAVERYKTMIQKFCEKCMNSDTKYSKLFGHLYIYNTPSMIDTIMSIVKPFVDPNIIGSITKYGKDESSERIRKLIQK